MGIFEYRNAKFVGPFEGPISILGPAGIDLAARVPDRTTESCAVICREYCTDREIAPLAKRAIGHSSSPCDVP